MALLVSAELTGKSAVGRGSADAGWAQLGMAAFHVSLIFLLGLVAELG